MTPRRVLVLVYPYPPVPSVGGNRWAAAAKHLRRHGHRVTVVTTSAYGAAPEDVPGEVVRTADLNAAGPLRALLRRPGLAGEGAGAAPAAPEEKPAPGLLTRVIVPDAFAASWTPAALLAARRLVRSERIDCVVTSSPFESTHLAGLGLGRSRPAWLADFRDGWTFEPLRPPFPTAAQRALDSRLERAVARGADAVVGATPPICADLERRFGIEAAYVPNGWDPDLEAGLAAAAPQPPEPGRVRLVHTGGMSNRGDPRPFFEALRRTAPELGGRLEVLLAGKLSPADARLVSDAADLPVRHLGLLPRAEAVALQRSAGALLLITSRQSSEATGKLSEYLASGRPILALAEGNVAAGIVRDTGTGLTVPPDDVDAIAAGLLRAAAGELDGLYRPRGLERYRFPHVAEALAEQIERAIARRA
jgi:glycosyltransferase involved in cell wall biosynthesis